MCRGGGDVGPAGGGMGGNSVSNYYYVTKPPPANALHVGILFPLSVPTLS